MSSSNLPDTHWCLQGSKWERGCLLSSVAVHCWDSKPAVKSHVALSIQTAMDFLLKRVIRKFELQFFHIDVLWL